MWCICHIKGIVHPKMKIWCLSAYPKGIQDVGDFVSSVEHKWRFFLSQTVAVCQPYNGSQWDPRLWETNKTCTDKTKLNPAARDDTLRSKDTKRLVCARNRTVFIYFFYLWSAARISSRAAGFNLVLSVYVFLVSQSRGSHWLPLYDWQTTMVWVKNIRLCSTEETKSPTSWMPWV